MDGQLIRVLVTAFAPVPGVSPHASALLGMAAAIRADMEMITLKTEALAHMERAGDARVLRVPTGLGTASEQRMAFGRACVRQIESAPYDVVHVRGAMEGQVLAERRKEHGFRFVYEIATFPDEAEGTDEERRWAEAHAICAEAADLIIVPTQAAARHLDESGHARQGRRRPPRRGRQHVRLVARRRGGEPAPPLSRKLRRGPRPLHGARGGQDGPEEAAGRGADRRRGGIRAAETGSAES